MKMKTTFRCTESPLVRESFRGISVKNYLFRFSVIVFTCQTNVGVALLKGGSLTAETGQITGRKFWFDKYGRALIRQRKDLAAPLT